jgi:hypothetical protein
MNSLDSAISVIAKWPATKQKEKATAKAMLAGLIADCEAAIKVWEGYLAAPTSSGDRWSIVTWIGAERGKQLHELNLDAKARLAAICRSAGGGAARTVDLEDNLIEMAYRMLAPGETGIEAAQSAVRMLQGRIEYLRGLSAQVAAVPAAAKAGPGPKRAAGKPKATKKKSAPGRKAVKRPVAKKGKRSAAKPKK